MLNEHAEPVILIVNPVAVDIHTKSPVNGSNLLTNMVMKKLISSIVRNVLVIYLLTNTKAIVKNYLISRNLLKTGKIQTYLLKRK